MSDLLRQTSSTTPVLFVLFPGYSPTKDIEACAATQVRLNKITSCFLPPENPKAPAPQIQR